MRRIECRKPRLINPTMTGTTGTTAAALGDDSGNAIVQRNIHDRIARRGDACLPLAIWMDKYNLNRHLAIVAGSRTLWRSPLNCWAAYMGGSE